MQAEVSACMILICVHALKMIVMKKILYVLDPLNFYTDNLEFADFIYGLTNSEITGIFFEHTDAENKPEEVIRHSAMEAGVEITGGLQDLPHQVFEKNVQRFKTSCDARDIPYSILRDGGSPLEDIILASRYADLILIDANTSFSKKEEEVPTGFSKDLLNQAMCPVMVMPVSYKGIEELVFTYDGRESSMYAIKQFTYLFPWLRNYKVVVLSVNPDTVSEEEWYKFREWLHSCYTRVDFLSSTGNTRSELLEMLHNRDNAIIVMGAFGRSGISNFFSHSHGGDVLKLTSQALFIAHH